MTYLYRCGQCGEVEFRDISADWRDLQTCPTCHAHLRRVFTPGVIQIPKSLHTSKELVMGKPGSPERDQFERDIRANKIVYAGPGSRWI